MAQRYNTGNPRPSNSMKDVNDNALANDDYLNSEADTFVDRLGDERDTLRGQTKKMLAAGETVVEETRQNLIPLSRQYMTLADAQADIANIPDGSATYVRSADDSALAIEVINNSGTLTATGRKMPSQDSVDDIDEKTNNINERTDGLHT
ncbi:GDSL family lipase, partial [Raoultella planticola]|nr:GDSL family lipase [Raoultella planticola]